jgi:hypothetical protein
MQQERVAQCFEGARLVPAEVARKDEIQNRASLGFVVNQPDILDAITSSASRCLALHGDRHRGWIASSGDVVSCSAPSLTLGSHGGKYRGSFYIHEFSTGAEGCIRLTTTEGVKVP